MRKSFFILFLVDIPISITNAICEKIFIELFRNKIKTNPPKIAKGTVRIIINGWMNELNVAAITRYAVNSAKANIIKSSLLVSLISSDLPFQVIWLLFGHLS